jgi:replication-associated recombination protein RarA
MDFGELGDGGESDVYNDADSSSQSDGRHTALRACGAHRTGSNWILAWFGVGLGPGLVEMRFFKQLKESIFSSPTNPFDKISGYDDLKGIVIRALDAEENYSLLFIGPPASAKTLFLEGILGMTKDGVYFDGSNTTNRILDVLEQERPRIICIDELDKMSKTFQNQLLNFMESGRVKVDQMRRQYDFEIKGAKVFATCNDINRLSKPLQSRFRKLYLSRYSQEQFLHVVGKVLPKLHQVLPDMLELLRGDEVATYVMF